MQAMARARLWIVCGLALVTPGVVSAQNQHPRVIIDSALSAGEILRCEPGVNFENQQYTIAHVTLDDPFAFLYWVNAKTRSLKPQLDSMLQGRSFKYQLVEHDALEMINEARFVPVTNTGFTVRVEFVSLRNCNASTKTLDVVYRIYSTNPPKVLGGAVEAQQTAEKTPQSTTGLTQAGNPFHAVPIGGYNRAYDVFGGARFEMTPRRSGFHTFNSLSVEGQGSSSMYLFAAALMGSGDFRNWMRHADWRLNYQNYSLPATAARLNNAALSAQFSGESRPFGGRLFFARFGAMLQGGNMQSSGAANLLAPQTVPNSSYGALKSYFGLSSRSSHNVFSLSYGLELGSAKPPALGWMKHIGDVIDEFWVPIGDHKPLEVETRLTMGGIQTLHSIPLPALFFGGNDDPTFVPGDSWQIRDAPVIRAIPANRFSQTALGLGAETFKSINLTISYPVKSHPLMPKDLSADPEFKSLLDGQIVSATSVEQNYYAWKDPHFVLALNRVPELKQKLDTLQNAVNAAQSAHPGRAPGAFDDCNASLGGAIFDIRNLLQTKKSDQYGDLMDLLPAGQDNWLGAVHASCVGELNQQLDDPALGAAAAAVDNVHAAILADFNAIDQKSAQQKATADMAFVNRTLKTLFNDLNTFSISPVAILDVASIGPSHGTIGGTRIGPGGGIRFELASSVNFTLGYAWNVDHHAGEGTGALFFSINTRDIFH